MKLIKKSGIFKKPEVIRNFESVTDAVRSLAGNTEVFKIFFTENGEDYCVDFMSHSSVGLLTASIDWLKEPAGMSVKKALKAGYHALIP